MNIQSTTRLLIVLLFTEWKKCDGQLTVDILKFEDTYQNLDTSSVLASYSFPTGFSNPLDWFTEPYANIPMHGAGYIGLLYHPVPHNACEPIIEHKQKDCASVCNASSLSSGSSKGSSLEDKLQLNLSKIAMVDFYHTCTIKKIENLQLAGFHGMITFGSETDDQNVNNRVYDNTAKSYIDVVSHEFPVAVVSKAFAQTLLVNATQKCSSLTDCQEWQASILVRVKGDSTRQGRIQIAIGIALVVVVVGVPLITCVVMCLCCILCCSSFSLKDCGCFTCRDSCRDGCTRCRERCSKSGVYEVHELQNRVLGSDLATTGQDNVVMPSVLSTRQSSRREEYLQERANSLHNLRRNETESNVAHSVQFRRTYETSMFKEREFTGEEKERSKSCTICLCDFEDGKKVRVLPCDKNHIFHSACIKQWLQTNSMCPVCRTLISIPNH